MIPLNVHKGTRCGLAKLKQDNSVINVKADIDLCSLEDIYNAHKVSSKLPRRRALISSGTYFSSGQISAPVCTY